MASTVSCRASRPWFRLYTPVANSVDNQENSVRFLVAIGPSVETRQVVEDVVTGFKRRPSPLNFPSDTPCHVS